MAGFIRRYGAWPGADVIGAIEGAVIIDGTPPGSVAPSGVGVACLVGEFADMTYAVAVDASGVVSSRPLPVEVFSSQDLVDKVGGFDSTIGKFGSDCGNGYVELIGKRFSRLVVVPINLASTRGVRVFRELPTNTAVGSATPVVPVLPAVVSAGREFKNGSLRARIAKKVTFYDDQPLGSGTDGATVGGGAAATQVMTAAGGNFIVRGVQEGDILVPGVIGGALGLGDNAGTYRIKSVDSSTQVTVEKLTGANFAWTAIAAMPWRIYPARCADTGGAHQASEEAGYIIPCRALDNDIAVATACTPTVVPAAAGATSWDPLSGLGMRTMPGATALVFRTNVGGANPSNHSDIAAEYLLALNSLYAEDSPASEVNIVWAARKYTTIRGYLKQHVLTSSAQGKGRIAILAPELDEVVTATIAGDADPGVGANRDERVQYTWPGYRANISDANGSTLLGADGSSVTDGSIDLAYDSVLASILSTLPPHRNPGEASQFTKLAQACVMGLQRNCPRLGIGEYTLLRQKGVAALRIDRSVGPIIQSGVTTSLTSGQKNINRRRMADYIEDSLAGRYVGFAKQPLTEALKGAILGETVEFMEGLLSPDNPANQQISAYEVDGKSGNTASTEAAGMFIVIVRARTLATADEIVLQAEIGEGVTITTT